ncbi:hypothetical protein LPJ72_003115 [Coemansia sp. Benny D160-2]|nr:hypothetical protein LPJ72_003115 [Coemansia sp. Benny D160-2]
MQLNTRFMCIAALAASVSAHMAMLSPCPRYSSKGKCPALPSGQQLDYSMTSPLGTNDPLCKHTVPYPTPCETWTAGQSVTVTFEGSATHGGGHCQWSISYDGGKTFVVLHQELGHCFSTGNSYTFSLPSDLPSSSKAVFAWSWVNAIGNREFYMNCADVAITGGSSSSFSGKEMVIANHAGYPTIPEFSGNYDTGVNYYNSAKTITVTAGGGSNVSGGDSYNSTSPGDSSNSSNSSSGDGNSYGGGGADSVNTPIAHEAPTQAPAPSYTSSALQNIYTLTPAQATYAAQEPTPSPPPSSVGDCDDSAGDSGNAQSAQYPSSARAAAIASNDNAADSAGAGSGAGSSSAGNEANNAIGSSGCSADGQMRCASSGGGYQVCVGGAWTADLSCAPETQCKAAGSSILCDRA